MKIESFFSNVKTGKEAVEKLKNAGFSEAYIDINDHYMDNRNVQTNLPGTETSVSLSGLVLESDATGIPRDKAPLEAASPMVSGMGRFEEIADANCKVIVNVSDRDEDRAKQIIRDAGGDLESPNVKKPEIKNDREIYIYNTLDQIRKET